MIAKGLASRRLRALSSFIAFYFWCRTKGEAADPFQCDDSAVAITAAAASIG